MNPNKATKFWPAWHHLMICDHIYQQTMDLYKDIPKYTGEPTNIIERHRQGEIARRREEDVVAYIHKIFD
jgi:hypothetical protein